MEDPLKPGQSAAKKEKYETFKTIRHGEVSLWTRLFNPRVFTSVPTLETAFIVNVLCAISGKLLF